MENSQAASVISLNAVDLDSGQKEKDVSMVDGHRIVYFISFF